jgi:hypothetical protein
MHQGARARQDSNLQQAAGLLSAPLPQADTNATGRYPSRYPDGGLPVISVTEKIHKLLILQMERVKGIEPSSSAWKALQGPRGFYLISASPNLIEARHYAASRPRPVQSMARRTGGAGAGADRLAARATFVVSGYIGDATWRDFGRHSLSEIRPVCNFAPKMSKSLGLAIHRGAQMKIRRLLLCLLFAGAAVTIPARADGWLGLYYKMVTDDQGEGALVDEVSENSPAKFADIRPGDIIMLFDGRHIRERDDLRNFTAGTSVGKKVEIVLYRNGGAKIIYLNIAQRPDTQLNSQMSSEDGSAKTASGGTLYLNCTMTQFIALDRHFPENQGRTNGPFKYEYQIDTAARTARTARIASSPGNRRWPEVRMSPTTITLCDPSCDRIGSGGNTIMYTIDRRTGKLGGIIRDDIPGGEYEAQVLPNGQCIASR